MRLSETANKAKRDVSFIAGHLLRETKKLWRKATSPLRTLPDIVIIGAQKSGTTSLHQYLCRHPRIKKGFWKEVHYFDDQHEKHPLWYRSHFGYHGDELNIEATPKYLFNEDAFWRMASLLPDITVIAVLREPVARAFSQYRHVRRGMGSCAGDYRSFEEAAQADMKFARKRRVLGRNTYADRYLSYVRRGLYAKQLERYKDRYGENLVVVQSENMFRDPETVVNGVFEEIGLEALELSGLKAHGSSDYEGEIPFRAQLEKFYAPHNEKLYDLLETDEWWSYS
jgi:hypothetical protein